MAVPQTSYPGVDGQAWPVLLLGSENFIYLAYSSSTNGGDTWSTGKLADGASVVHLPRTSQGLMVGDYLSVSMVDGGTKALTTYAMGRYSSTSDTINSTWPRRGWPVVGLTVSIVPGGGVVAFQEARAPPKSLGHCA